MYENVEIQISFARRFYANFFYTASAFEETKCEKKNYGKLPHVVIGNNENSWKSMVFIWLKRAVHGGHKYGFPHVVIACVVDYVLGDDCFSGHTSLAQ